MILLPSFKSKTKHKKIQTLNSPKYIHLPLDAYRGKMKPILEVGERVKKFQLVALSEGKFSSKIHAPISGRCLGEFEIEGKSFLKIENDFQEEELVRNPIDLNQLTKDEILHHLLDFGIEGSGGAGFPTHLKYTFEEKEIKYFLVNAAECEPYLSADYALLEQRTDELFQAIEIIEKSIHPKLIVFGIEKQHRKLKEVLERHFKKNSSRFQLKILPDEYPQGGELQLIKSLTGIEIPKGSIPANHGIIVNNVGTLWAIYNGFYRNEPYVERVITVAGKNVKHEGNYNVKIGTPISHILKETHTTLNTDQLVILGGPMMGKLAFSSEIPISKGTGGVLIFNELASNAQNCIECGYCVDACPQNLMPMEFVKYNLRREKEKLNGFNLVDCIECGACAYACPSEVPLMQNIVEGKKLLLNSNA